MKRLRDLKDRLFPKRKKETQLVSPEGLEVIASAGSKPTDKRPNFFENTTVSLEEIGEATILFNACGHTGSMQATTEIWGNRGTFNLPEDAVQKTDTGQISGNLCVRCHFERLKKAAIRCCLCGFGILPNNSVALYGKSSGGVHAREATLVGDDAVIGCIRSDCSPAGFFAGYWTFDGFRPAFGGLTAAGAVFATGKTIIGNI